MALPDEERLTNAPRRHTCRKSLGWAVWRITVTARELRARSGRSTIFLWADTEEWKPGTGISAWNNRNSCSSWGRKKCKEKVDFYSVSTSSSILWETFVSADILTLCNVINIVRQYCSLATAYSSSLCIRCLVSFLDPEFPSFLPSFFAFEDSPFKFLFPHPKSRF